MNVGQVSLIRSRCVCFPKARAFASSDVGAYGTSASPTAGGPILIIKELILHSV